MIVQSRLLLMSFVAFNSQVVVIVYHVTQTRLVNKKEEKSTYNDLPDELLVEKCYDFGDIYSQWEGAEVEDAIIVLQATKHCAPQTCRWLPLHSIPIEDPGMLLTKRILHPNGRSFWLSQEFILEWIPTYANLWAEGAQPRMHKPLCYMI